MPDRSITVRISKVRARTIVDQMTILGLRSVSSDIEKALHRIGEYATEDGWETRKPRAKP